MRKSTRSIHRSFKVPLMGAMVVVLSIVAFIAALCVLVVLTSLVVG